MNIWVCNFSNEYLLGYAQFPSELTTSPNTDGVVISYKAFGTNGTAGTHPFEDFTKGRTATHEVGHWLNLRHIWGDDDNNNGYCTSNECSGSDGVGDTPNQGERNEGCPTFPKTDCCTSSNPGVMFMNYMDYTNDACMNLFTAGQVIRMRALFDSETGARREMMETAECLTNPVIYINNQTYNTGTHTISGCKIEISNTTINANTTVNIHSQQGVTLKPGFWAKSGSTVSIKALQASSPSLLSAQVVEMEDNADNLTSLEQAVASQKSSNIDFTVYPNPNDGNFTIKVTGNTQAYTVEIFNASGGLLGKVDCNAEAITINRSDLPAGIYYLKLSAGSESAVKKLFVK